VDKHLNLAVAAGHSLNAAGWRRVSALVLDRFAGRFARVETRRTAAEFVTGLLSDLEVKTSWQLAEYAGHDRPDAMQRLLYRANGTPTPSVTTSGKSLSTGSATPTASWWSTRPAT
jgi:hypothetical protein